MKYFNVIVLAILSIAMLLYVSYQEKSSQDTYTTNWDKALEHAQSNLPHEGTLVVGRDGFVYLKVSDEYINELFPILDLEKEGFRKPPFFRTGKSPGAHISVFYKQERIHPKELGRTFHFNIKKVEIVQPNKWDEFAILKVESPELEQLREKYGLSPKLKGHDFHITIGKKRLRRISNLYRSYPANMFFVAKGFSKPFGYCVQESYRIFASVSPL